VPGRESVLCDHGIRQSGGDRAGVLLRLPILIEGHYDSAVVAPQSVSQGTIAGTSYNLDDGTDFASSIAGFACPSGYERDRATYEITSEEWRRT
jgi:hypothetical protein